MSIYGTGFHSIIILNKTNISIFDHKFALHFEADSSKSIFVHWVVR